MVAGNHAKRDGLGGPHIMTQKIDIKTAMNFLIVFDNAESNFAQSQAETFAKRFPEIRKACQHIVKTIGKATGKERDKIALSLGLGYIVNNKAKRDMYAAIATIAGEHGVAIGRAAKAGKLGKCSTLRGAVTSYKRHCVATTQEPAKRKPRQPNAADKKQVSFVAKKKPQTVAAKLELLEAVALANGFSFTDFVAEWTAEVEADDAGKKVANG